MENIDKNTMEQDGKRKKVAITIVAILTVLTSLLLLYCWQSQIVAYVEQTDASQKINLSEVDKNDDYDAIQVSCIDTLRYRFSDDNIIIVDGVEYKLAPNTAIVNQCLFINEYYKLISNKDISLTSIDLSSEDNKFYIQNINEDYLSSDTINSKDINDFTYAIIDENTLFIVSSITINDSTSYSGLYNPKEQSFITKDGEIIIEDEDNIIIGGVSMSGENFKEIAYDILNKDIVTPITPTEDDTEEDVVDDDTDITTSIDNNTQSDDNISDTNEQDNNEPTDTNDTVDNNTNGSTNNGTNGGSTPQEPIEPTTPPIEELVAPVITLFNANQIDYTNQIEMTWSIDLNDYNIDSIDIYVDGIKIDTIDGSETSYIFETTYDEHSVQIKVNYEDGTIQSHKIFIAMVGTITMNDITIDSDTDSTTITGIDITGTDLDSVTDITIEFVGENGDTISYTLTPDEVEAIKNGEPVNIIIDGFESDSKYIFTITAKDENGNDVPVSSPSDNYIYTDAIAPTITSTDVELDYYNKSDVANTNVILDNPDLTTVTITDVYNNTFTSTDNLNYNTSFNVSTTPGTFNYEILEMTYIKNQGTNEIENISLVNHIDSYTVRKEMPLVNDGQGLVITPDENSASMNLSYTDVDNSITEMTYSIYDENQVLVPGHENIYITTYNADETLFDVSNLTSGATYYISVDAKYDDLDSTNNNDETNLIKMQEFTLLPGTNLTYVSSDTVNPITTTSAQLNNIEFTGNAIPFIASGEIIVSEYTKSVINNNISYTYSMTPNNIIDIQEDNILTSFNLTGLEPNTNYEVSFNFITLNGTEIIIDAASTGIQFRTDNVEPVVVSHTITDGTTENGIYIESTPLTGTIIFDNPVETVTLSNGINATSTDGITWTYTTNATSPSTTNTVAVESFTYIENQTLPGTLIVDSLANTADDTIYTTQKVVPTYVITPWDNGLDDDYKTLSFTTTVTDPDMATENLDINLYNVDDPDYAAGELVDSLDSCVVSTSTPTNCTTTTVLDSGATYEVRLEGTYETYNPADVEPVPLASLELRVQTFLAMDIVSYDTVVTTSSIDFTNIMYSPIDNEYVTTMTVEIKDDQGVVVDTLEYSQNDITNTVINDINAGNPFNIYVDGLDANKLYTATITTTFADGEAQVATGMNPMSAYTNAITPTISSVEVTPEYINHGQSGDFIVTFENPSDAQLNMLNYTNSGGGDSGCMLTSATDSGDQTIASCPFMTNDVPMKDAALEVVNFNYYPNDGATTTVTASGYPPVLYNVTKDMPTMVLTDFISFDSVEVSDGAVDLTVEFKYLDTDSAATNVRVNAYEDFDKNGVADSQTPASTVDAVEQNNVSQTVTLNGLVPGQTYIIEVMADVDTFNPNEGGVDYSLLTTSYTLPAGTFINITGGELTYVDELGTLLPTDTLMLQNVTLTGSGVSSLATATGTVTLNGSIINIPSNIMTDFADGTQDNPVLITGLDADTLYNLTFDFDGFTESQTIQIQNYTNKEQIVVNNITFNNLNNAYMKGSSGTATLNVTDNNPTSTDITSITSPDVVFDPINQTAPFTAPGTPGVAGEIGEHTINVNEVCTDINQDAGTQEVCLSTNVIGTYYVIADQEVITVTPSNISDLTASLTIDIYDIDSIVQNPTITVKDSNGNFAKDAIGNDVNNIPVTDDMVMDLTGLVSDETYTYTINYQTDIYDGNGLQDEIYTGTFTTIMTEVTSVSITSGENNVDAGSTSHQYGATITGIGTISQDVTWSVTGNEDSGTIIDSQGMLTIGNDEDAASISVRATSVQDPTKYGEMVVTINPIIYNIIVTGDSSVDAGESTNPFVATKEGYGNYENTTVSWTVSGSNSVTNGTTIDSNGVLTVATDELASTLTVTATSDFNPTISGSTTINVNTVATGVTVTGSTEQVVGTTATYTADAIGYGSITDDVTWSITGNTSSSTTIDENGLLTVGLDEMATTITVVATSIYAPNPTGQVNVTIIPEYTDIVITGPTDLIVGTMNNNYDAVVSGNGNINTTPVWNITGSQSATNGTTIDPATGKVNVAIDELATTLNVVATSADGTITETYTVNVIPVIYSVTITGPLDVYAGSTGNTFVGTVSGAGNFNDTVTWSLQGNTSDATTIDTNTGILTVGADETSPTLTIVATASDGSTMDSLAINVIPDEETVTVSGPTAVNAGATNIPFTALVEGLGAVSQNVTWSISGNTSASTTINTSGMLTVGQDEMAQTITIKATSSLEGIIGELVVTINPVVNGVTIEGPDGVFANEVTDFNATVTGYGAITQNVTWSIQGNTDATTTIDANGGVTVGDNESAPMLTIKATSVDNTSKYATKMVGVNTAINSVTINNGPTDVEVDSTGNQYSATVDGQGTYDQNKIWSISGNTSSSTTIDSNGVLTVGADEMASTITVKATSVQDPSKFDTMDVNINIVVEDITITGANPVNIGTQAAYRATVTGKGNVSQEVTWSISGQQSTGTTINASTGILTVANDEPLTSTIVVKATSVQDPTVYGEMFIALGDQEFNIIEENLDIVYTATGTTVQINATLDDIPTTDVIWEISTSTNETVPSDVISIDETGLITIHDGRLALGLDWPLKVTGTLSTNPNKTDFVLLNGIYEDENGVTWIKFREDSDGNVLLATEELVGKSTFRYTAGLEYEGSILEANMEDFWDGTYTGNNNYSGIGNDLKEISLPVNMHNDTEKALTGSSYKVDRGNGVITEVDYVNGEYTTFPLSWSEIHAKSPTSGYNGDPNKIVQWDEGIDGVTAGTNGSYWTSSDTNYGANHGVAYVENAGNAFYSNPAVAERGVRPAVWVDPAKYDSLAINGPTDVNMGSTTDYSAIKDGTETPVTWSMTGNLSPGTTIDANTGVLTVASDELASYVVLTATSIENPTEYEEYYVHITPNVETITIVGPTEQGLGKNIMYTANVTGTGANLAKEDIEWTVSGQTSANTRVTPEGLLMIAADETATSLTITATSTSNPAVYDTHTVNITSSILSMTVNGVTSVSPGSTTAYTATVNGAGEYSSDVTWSLYGNLDQTSSIDSNGNLYIAPTETSETITIRATSTQDMTIYDEHIITILQPEILITTPIDPVITFGDTGSTFQFDYTVQNGAPEELNLIWTLYDKNGVAVPTEIMSINSTGLLTIHDGLKATGVDGPLKLVVTDQYISTLNVEFTNITGKYIDNNNVTWVKWREDTSGNVLLTTEYVMGNSSFSSTNSSNDYNNSSLETAYESYYNGNYTGNTTYTGVGNDLKDASLPVSLNTDTENATILSGNTVENGNAVVTEVDENDGKYTAFPLSMSEINKKCTATGDIADTCKVSNYSEGAIGATPGEAATYYTSSDVVGSNNGVATVMSDGKVTYNDTINTAYGVRPSLWIDPNNNEKIDITGPTNLSMGESADYSAKLNQVEATGITWSISGQTSPSTTIDSTGTLSIGSDESATTITITATDGILTDTYKVKVNPIITSIDVTGPTYVYLGESYEYTATVNGQGTNLANEDLIWSISGETSDATTITNNGTLAVGLDEGASQLTVTATSTSNPTIKGNLIVDIAVPTSLYTISGPTELVAGPNNLSIVPTDGVTTYPVTWSISGNNSPNTTIDANTGVLTIDADETASSINIKAHTVGNELEFTTTTINIANVVNSVNVSGEMYVPVGTTSQYTFDLNGTGNINRDVTWEVVGEAHPGTTIDSTGLLTVAETETADMITINAKSVENPSIVGSITVDLTINVTEVVINGAASVNAGTSAQYNADVIGLGTYDETVTWSLTGNNDPATTLSESGLLTVSPTETAPSVTITAISNANPIVTASKEITINTVINGITITGPTTVTQGSSTQYNATIDGAGNLNGVTWSIQGQSSHGTTIDETGLLTIDPSETSTSLTIFATSVDNPSIYEMYTVSITPALASMDYEKESLVSTLKNGILGINIMYIF